MIRFSGIGVTDIGRTRQENEDTYLVDEALQLYVVCDGLGGHARGEVASQMAAEVARDAVARICLYAGETVEARDDEQLMAWVVQAIDEASEVVCRTGLQDPRSRGMATTLTLLWIVGERAIVGHVGDSRLYRWRRGRVTQLSKDQTLAEELRAAGVALGPEQTYDHVLTQAVGWYEQPLPEVRVIRPRDGDVFLLCTDGLSDAIDVAAELGAMLGWAGAEELPALLIDAANGRSGRDNITALVVHPSGTGATGTSARVHRRSA